MNSVMFRKLQCLERGGNLFYHINMPKKLVDGMSGTCFRVEKSGTAIVMEAVE